MASRAEGSVMDVFIEGPWWPQRVLHGAIASAMTVLMLNGCSGPKVEVASDTTWTGNVNGASVDGAGGKTFEIDSGTCAAFQKDTEGGFLRVRVKHWEGAGRWRETTAPYGIVNICESD
jgi:hypothetical protein